MFAGKLILQDMIIKLKDSTIRAGKWYEGFISRHLVDKTKGILKVYVMLDEDVNNDITIEYIQVIPLDTNENSKFAQFSRRMKLLTQNGDVDTRLLDELAVKAILNRGKDSNLYVSTLRIDWDYYNKQSNMEEDEDMEDSEE